MSLGFSLSLSLSVFVLCLCCVCAVSAWLCGCVAVSVSVSVCASASSSVSVCVCLSALPGLRPFLVCVFFCASVSSESRRSGHQGRQLSAGQTRADGPQVRLGFELRVDAALRASEMDVVRSLGGGGLLHGYGPKLNHQGIFRF